MVHLRRLKRGKTMKLGDIVSIQKEAFKIIKEYNDAFLAISESGFNLKTIPKLQVIK